VQHVHFYLSIQCKRQFYCGELTKNLIISKLENKLKNNDNIQLLNKTDNHIELLETKTDVLQNSMPTTIQNNTTNEQTVILTLPIKKKSSNYK
jgi:hypothetical protein